MAKVTISMPDPMADYVSDRITSGQYGNVSEYFRDLVRKDQERQSAREELRTLLDQAEDSGLSERSVPEILADSKARAKAHFGDA